MLILSYLENFRISFNENNVTIGFSQVDYICYSSKRGGRLYEQDKQFK